MPRKRKQKKKFKQPSLEKRQWLKEHGPEKYADFVEHPRYGRSPRFTGQDPPEGLKVQRWRFPRGSKRISGTAIEANVSKQMPAMVPFAFYYDVAICCRDCGRSFIFFAEEQKHWYEKLGFALDADCVRCVPCRKKQQGLQRIRERYEELRELSEPTGQQYLDMAECAFDLVEGGGFAWGKQQEDRIRMFLNRAAKEFEGSARHTRVLEELHQRLAKMASEPEASARGDADPR